MNVYETHNLGNLLKPNPYAGRGIVVGKTADGTCSAVAYFIMGRSENSRNRIFEQNGKEITIYPFDASKVEDPSLIIYSPVRTVDNKLIVTNGDQTDTIYDYVAEGSTFEEALETREFEPDAPNFTPRISAMLTFADEDFSYKMSILKSADPEGSACTRETFSFPAVSGVGHFLHTYVTDGNPIPTFVGEPERVDIVNDIDAFTTEIWDNLNEQNKISIYTIFTNLKTNETQTRLINKNTK